MKKHGLIILLFTVMFFIFASASAAQLNETKTIAVVGFINQGDKMDDTINKVISKSLITFLAKIKGTKVTAYDAVEKLSADNKFWESKELDADIAVEMGLDLAVKQVVTGTYKVNKKAGTIKIVVYVYDPITSELKLKRNYFGDAGISIFDTIDKLIRNISSELVGHAVTMGNLEVDIDSDKTYNLLINKVFQKKVSKSDGFNEKEEGEEPLDVSLTLTENDQEIYHKEITLKDNENRVITYTPSGTAVVRTGTGGIKVYADDVFAGETEKSGEIIVHSLKAGTNHIIRIEKENKTLDTRTITVEEGKTIPVEFFINGPAGQRQFFFPVEILEGGLGGEVGFGWYFTDSFRVFAEGGAIYLPNVHDVFPEAETGLALAFLKSDDFRIWVDASVFAYISSPVIISPVIKLELSWGGLFINGGVRYGFTGSQVIPMLSFGIRL